MVQNGVQRWETRHTSLHSLQKRNDSDRCSSNAEKDKIINVHMHTQNNSKLASPWVSEVVAMVAILPFPGGYRTMAIVVGFYPVVQSAWPVVIVILLIVIVTSMMLLLLLLLLIMWMWPSFPP